MASGIMIHLKATKSATKEKAIAAATATNADSNNDAINEGKKGTQVLLKLTEPWHHSDCITANAYFASVEVVMKLKEKDLF
jgi:hypothetical protein